LKYTRPNIKRGKFSHDEDKVICVLFASICSRWSIMAAQLPGRTDNDINNYWNTKLKKKMMSNLITLLEHRKTLQHLQCFISSTNYSYPSRSIFQNSNINVNAPLSSSISSSPSYLYSINTSSYHDQTLSIPSSPRINDANLQHPVLQSQDHGFLGLFSTETYQQEVKDSSTLVFIGGDQASYSSNSDGSCHYQYRSTVGVYCDSPKLFRF
ncbi:transcription factor MYB87-like, partial [Lactuca sativa]|uniref:transcription factor MYB87-like n=1 Tax=Lactuca sativa TaxID=4236 RepID=UPI000CD9D1CB